MPKPGAKQESPIAANAEIKTLLRRVSDEARVPQITVLEHAIRALACYFDHHGKRLLLPLNFDETFAVRTIRVLHDPLRVERQSTHRGNSERNRKGAGAPA